MKREAGDVRWGACRWRRVVDAREAARLGKSCATPIDVTREDETDADDEVEAAGSEEAHSRLAILARRRLEKLDRHTELLLRAQKARVGRVVEALVAASADVEDQPNADVCIRPRRRAGGRRASRGRSNVAASAAKTRTIVQRAAPESFTPSRIPRMSPRESASMKILRICGIATRTADSIRLVTSSTSATERVGRKATFIARRTTSGPR